MTTDPKAYDVALLRLLQMVSPALPIGAYAYSQGLETAVARHWVTNETEAEQWIGGLLRHPLTYLDIPLFVRLSQAWKSGDMDGVSAWNARLYASREAAELQQEDRCLGMALARLLADLGFVEAKPWRAAPRVCFATLFSLAAVRWEIPLVDAAKGYLWTWTENQIAAAIKLIPLGQTSGQQILSRLLPEIVAAVQHGIALEDADIGYTTPGLGLASALHEVQYSRLFRS